MQYIGKARGKEFQVTQTWQTESGHHKEADQVSLMTNR